MNKLTRFARFFTALQCFTTFLCIGQITFQSGYLINNNGEKIACLIKNMDWRENPTQFKYKIAEDAETQSGSIESVKEFVIHNEAKFIRAAVSIDASRQGLSELNRNRNPEFRISTLFLKVIVEGKASLASYSQGNITKFFYRTGDSTYQQLVYKRYLTEKIVRENNYFRQQLFNDLKCADVTMNNVENLDYKLSDLKQFFIQYNQCSGGNYVDPVVNTAKQKRRLLAFSIRPGLTYQTLTIANSATTIRNTDFGEIFSFRIGGEIELTLPYNKNKWAVLAEPCFQFFDVTAQPTPIAGFVIVPVAELKYRLISVPIGIRYHLFFNSDSRLFVNVLYPIGISTNSKIRFERNDGSLISDLDVGPATGIVFGVGYKYKRRLSAELRYESYGNLLGNYFNWTADYYSISAILGVRIF